jgi:hypothetical protein
MDLVEIVKKLIKWFRSPVSCLDHSIEEDLRYLPLQQKRKPAIEVSNLVGFLKQVWISIQQHGGPSS